MASEGTNNIFVELNFSEDRALLKAQGCSPLDSLRCKSLFEAVALPMQTSSSRKRAPLAIEDGERQGPQKVHAADAAAGDTSSDDHAGRRQKKARNVEPGPGNNKTVAARPKPPMEAISGSASLSSGADAPQPAELNAKPGGFRLPSPPPSDDD